MASGTTLMYTWLSLTFSSISEMQTLHNVVRERSNGQQLFIMGTWVYANGIKGFNPLNAQTDIFTSKIPAVFLNFKMAAVCHLGS